MAKFCTECGNLLGKDVKFCTKCGAAVNSGNPQQKTNSNENNVKKTKVEVLSPEIKQGAFCDYFKETVAKIGKLLKNPKVLFKAILPSLIIAVIWTLLAFLEMAYPKNAVIRVFSFFTYAQGGMFGGFFGALGGIVGKALFAYLLCTVVNAIVNKRKISFKEIFAGFKINGLSALGCFLIGAGVAVLLYLAMNITSSAQNAMIGVAGAVMVAMAAGQKNSLLLMAVCGLAKLLTRGKAPSQITVSRLLSGMTTGFVVAVPLSMPRSAWICPVVSLLLIAAGIITIVFGKKNRAVKTTAMMFVLVVLASQLMTLTAQAADYKSGDWLTVDEFYDYYNLRDVFGRSVADSDINEKIKDSGKKLLPSEFEVVLCEVENDGVLYAQRIAEQKYDCSYDKTADSNVDKTYILGKEAIDITIAGEESTNYVGSLEYDYNIQLKNLTFSYGALIKNLGSPFKVSYTVDGSSYASGSYYEERQSVTYSETYSAKYNVPEVQNDSLSCSVSDDGVMLLKMKIKPTSQENYDDGQLTTATKTYITLRFAVSQVKIESKSGASEGLLGLIFGGNKDNNNNEDNNDIDPNSLGWVISEDPSADENYKEPTGDGSETRKGVPLRDYDHDGDIDYNDRQIQYELIHDPDFLTRNGTAGATVVAIISLISAILGGTFGVVGGATAGVVGATSSAIGGTTAGSFGSASQYIKFDEAGDIEWTDPATGKMIQYVRQKDGKYLNPLTDQSYTYNELYESAAYRERNAEGFAQDAETAEYNVEKQRAESGGLSDNAKEHAEVLRQLEAIAQDKEKMINLANKYYLPADMEKDELFKAVLQKMDEERSRGNTFVAQGNRMAMYEKSAETVSTATDISMDFLSNLTGPVGKGINAGYKIATGAVSKGVEEANYSDGNVTAGIMQGVIEGSIDAATDFLGGKTKAAATIAGETTKGGLDAYIDGKDVVEGMMDGAKKGTVNAAIDLGSEKIGNEIKKAHMPGGSDTEMIKHINESDDATAKKIVEGIKNYSDKVDAGVGIPNNFGKDVAESAMEKDDSK